MNDNLMVVETMEDGRWNDEAWVTEQAEISSMQESIERGTEVS